MILPVPAGHLAAVVTELEMTAPPDRPGPAMALRRDPRPDLARYLAFYREIGEDWLWYSRLGLSDAALAEILHDPKVEVHVGANREGLVELDFRRDGVCSITFFGLVPSRIGRGDGRRMMTAALALAWREGVGKVRLQTCTLDHPGALGFYLRCGFRAVARRVEIAPDPRLDGPMGPDVAPHHPLIR